MHERRSSQVVGEWVDYLKLITNCMDPGTPDSELILFLTEESFLHDCGGAGLKLHGVAVSLSIIPGCVWQEALQIGCGFFALPATSPTYTYRTLYTLVKALPAHCLTLCESMS